MRPIITGIAFFVIIIAAVILIASRGSDDDRRITDDGEEQIELTDYTHSSATVRHTIEGEINAEEEHNSIRISVNPNRREIDILRGYNGRVIESRTFSNTRAAYDNFLYALKNAGFNLKQEALYVTEKGVCPFGTRTVYQLIENGEARQRLWSSSCDNEDGNFAGDDRRVRRLFEAQIPDYRDFTRDVDL